MNDWLDDAKKAVGDSDGNGEKEYAETWKPEAGDMLAGTVVRGDFVPTSNGDTHLLVVRDDETGKEYTVWCSSYMLKQQVIDLAPAMGSLIVIAFHGKKQSKKDPSRSFNDYTMKVEKSDFEYWNQIMKRHFARQQLADTSSGGGGGVRPSFGPDEVPF